MFISMTKKINKLKYMYIGISEDNFALISVLVLQNHNVFAKYFPHLKVGACSANFIPILLKCCLNYQSQFLTTKRISFTTKSSKEN